MPRHFLRTSLALAAFLGGVTAVAHAQTIQPLASEYQTQARGRFEVTNNSDQPLHVVVEPKGFSVGEDGRVRDEPFPADVRVTLSAMSFRLPPRQSRFVFYEAASERSPAWFVLYANLSGYPQRDFSGINIQLELPHIVYLLPRESWRAGDVRVVEASFNRETRRVEILVQNDGPSFGRVAAVQIAGGGQRVTVPGFPLFPGGRRRLDVEWSNTVNPESVQVTAANISVRRTITPSER